ncbi:integrase core domain-containing protein, partial [uncultured Cobetia sp.]|uniref:integrase core domain-containing protein n=1 Tax=uncultured Cobetia sp. TaxID=410706 RepID=UPI0025991A90
IIHSKSGGQIHCATTFLLARPKDLMQARKMVRESIDIYNQARPHLALKYKTPDAVHRAF